MDYRGIIQLNALGMQLLCSGNCLEAGNVFRKALSKLVTILLKDKDRSIQDRILTLSPVESIESLATKLPFDQPTFTNTFACFANALTVCWVNNYDLADEQNQSLMSVVLLFNFALSFHVTGISQAKSQERNLHKALELYNKAVDILDANIGIFNVPILTLAIANNVGSIYSHFFRHDEAKRCLKLIRFVLEGFDLNEHSDETLSIFRTNVTLLLVVDPSYAPAAAA